MTGSGSKDAETLRPDLFLSVSRTLSNQEMLWVQIHQENAQWHDVVLQPLPLRHLLLFFYARRPSGIFMFLRRPGAAVRLNPD